MKRYLLVSLVVLAVTPGMAPAAMTGGSMSGADAPAPPPAHREKSQASDSGTKPGMMGQGMMPGMMGQGKDMMGGCMMSGGMMGPEMMGTMMPAMMDGMMPGPTRGCMMMAEGMMKGQVDLVHMRKALALSDEQLERLRAGQRPFQKETILTLASLKVAELELADLLAAEKADFGKVEAKLKEIEGMRTKVRLAHIRATMAVRGILSTEQLERLQGMSESAPPLSAPAAPRKDAAPGTDAEHEQHH